MLNPFSFPGTCCALHGLEHMLTHFCRRPFAITTSVVATSGCCDEPAHCHQIYSPTSFNNTCPGGSASRRVPVVTMRQRGKMTANSQMIPILSTLSLHHPAFTSIILPSLPSAGRDAWGEGAAQRQNPLQLKTATTIGILMDARLVSRHRFYFTKSLVCHWLWEELRYNMLQHGSSAMDDPFDYNTTAAKRESKVDDSCLFILHPDNFHKLCRQNLGTSVLT